MAKKILLADDSITIQKVVELTFSDGDYEVIAVNNGAKAIQKLAEMRPDIILSDIIMPEKNGYEVCEYVKSHPEFRNIPVVLLTGTFEPFDPDRADKAGCDAVVTKPFESQSLIHKVEELIEQSRSHAAPLATPTPVAIPDPAATPWDDSPVAPPARPAGFNVGGFSAPPIEPAYASPAYNAPAATDPFSASSFQSNSNDIFGAAPVTATPATTEMPFEPPVAPAFGHDEPTNELAYGGETRAFPRMSFDELQASAQNHTPPAPIEPSPWDEPATPQSDFSGETRAFPQMSYDDLQRMATPHVVPEVHHEPSIEPTPWDEPAAPPSTLESGETRAFPQISHEEFQQFAPHQEAPAYQPQHEAEPAPWDQPASEHAFGGETQAFPRMTYEELQQAAAPHAAAPADEPSWMQQPIEQEPVSQHETPAQHEPEIETSPWAQQEAAEPEPAPWDSEPTPAAAPWAEEQPAFDHEEPIYGGETRAFPRLSAEELQQMAAGQHPAAPTPEVEPEPAPWEEPAPSAIPQWSQTAEPSSTLEVGSVDSFTSDSFSTEAASPFAQSMEESPFDDTAIAPGPISNWSPAEAPQQQQQYAPQAEQHEQFAASAPEPAEEVSHATVAYQSPMQDTTAPQYFAAHEPEPAVASAPAPSASTAGDLSDEQVDRIARRVVQLMSEQVVKNIAWEVIPDLAEIVVKERIRQLESEA